MSADSLSRDSVAYVNGRVYTVNDEQPWAKAFIVSPEGIFTHIDTTDVITAFAKEHGLVTYDLKNTFILPGLHDAHSHMLIGGLVQLNEVDIGMDSNAENIAKRIKDARCNCEYLGVYEDWIVANGYSNFCFEGGKPDRELLDKEFPYTPVVVRGGGGHALWLNSEALRRAGYDEKNEPDEKGALSIRRGDGEGELTGELWEAAQSKVCLALPIPPLAQAKRALSYAIKKCHECGITSVQDASSNTLMMTALQELEKENRLDLDFATHLVHSPVSLSYETKAASLALIDRAEEFKSKHVFSNFVKVILDGVPLPPAFTHCELDSHGAPDEKKILADDLEEAVLKYDRRGMTVKVHCTGRGSTRLALDAFEKARRQNPNGPRHEIAHCNSIHPDDLRRFKPLNVTAEMSPALFFPAVTAESSHGLMDWNFARMLEHAALTTIGSDWSVMSKPELLQSVACKLDDIGRGDKEKGAHLLLHVLTLEGAKAVGKENETGSIEVGKRANFIAVDRDLSKGEFEGAQVLRTWFEGRMVYSRKA